MHCVCMVVSTFIVRVMSISLYLQEVSVLSVFSCVCRYSSVHFIDLEVLCSERDEVRELKPSQFEALVKNQCANARRVLQEG